MRKAYKRGNLEAKANGKGILQTDVRRYETGRNSLSLESSGSQWRAILQPLSSYSSRPLDLAMSIFISSSTTGKVLLASRLEAMDAAKYPTRQIQDSLSQQRIIQPKLDPNYQVPLLINPAREYKRTGRTRHEVLL